jgi:hypothetical protein
MDMGHRRLRLLALLPFALGAAGCQGDRELQQELLNIKNETTLQLELLNRHSEFLVQKSEMVEGNLATLTDEDRRLSREVAIYTARPDQIRREILGEVDTRAEMATERRERFSRDIADRLDARGRALSEKTSQTIAKFQSALDHDRMFLTFVFAHQDSMNRVFANRFDDRPWYESVLGRWEAQQNPTP